MKNTKTILIAPLDWGLGHATRCMPIINLLLEKKHRIIIAGNGDSFYLLKEQYPALTFYELPGYNITYATGKNAAFYALLQTPKIIKTINKEHEVIKQIVAIEKVDLLISDNRYGVWHHKVKSIIICHQIALQAPNVFKWTNSFFLAMHLKRLQKFDTLWIPDEPDENNLSGNLSHQISFGMPYAYIGIQSRFNHYLPQPSFVQAIPFSILVVLSGPEPQRTYLEKKLIEQLSSIKAEVLLVQGKTATFLQTTQNNITVVSYLSANDMYCALQKATVIICRSGYSTIMDLAVLGKKAILIPTQGQTEQEYLAKKLHKKEMAIACYQDNFDIQTAIQNLAKIKGFSKYTVNTEKLEAEIQQL